MNPRTVRNNFSYLKRHLFWKRSKPDFGRYEVVQPGKVSSRSIVPDHIRKPSYHISGEPTEAVPDRPEVKTAEQIERMRESCRLAANILKKIESTVQVNKTTDAIDKEVFRLCIENNVYPSPLNYKGFPKSVCTSVNNVACHGIPDDRALKDGDIINVDITVFHNDYHGDCSKTFLVGNVDMQGQELVAATEDCLTKAINLCKPGRYFGEIGYFIEHYASKMGFQVIPAFIGHGIGHYFHGPPDIYHIVNRYPGQMLPGMTFTIEPVLTQGGRFVELLEDDWTTVTVDLARTAQFEHTVLITESGVEILTLAT